MSSASGFAPWTLEGALSPGPPLRAVPSNPHCGPPLRCNICTTIQTKLRTHADALWHKILTENMLHQTLKQILKLVSVYTARNLFFLLSSVASSTTVCCRPGQTAISRCSFEAHRSLALVYTLLYKASNDVAALFEVFEALFDLILRLRIRSLTLQTFAAVQAVLGVSLYRSAYVDHSYNLH